MNQFLAYIFDAFKAKNPKIASIILLVLITAYAFFSNQIAINLLGPTISKWGEWISVILAGLQGTRTTQILRESNNADK